MHLTKRRLVIFFSLPLFVCLPVLRIVDQWKSIDRAKNNINVHQLYLGKKSEPQFLLSFFFLSPCSNYPFDSSISVHNITMPKLVLVRHGQSEWNEKNLFTGWVDVRLSETGQKEAKRAGELLKEAGINVDVLHTSKLSRAIQTANIALDAADQLYVPVKRSWRLNERHYGALQGKDKAQTLEAYGQEKFQIWRRSLMFHHQRLIQKMSTPKSATEDTLTLIQLLFH